MTDPLRNVSDTSDSRMTRHSALAFAIEHLAGDGSKVADRSGTGKPVVECALTFERYLRGDDALTTQERTIVVRLLGDLVDHLGRDRPFMATGVGEASKTKRWADRNAALVEETAAVATRLKSGGYRRGGAADWTAQDEAVDAAYAADLREAARMVRQYGAAGIEQRLDERIALAERLEAEANRLAPGTTDGEVVGS